jgi:hypothetical protein
MLRASTQRLARIASHRAWSDSTTEYRAPTGTAIFTTGVLTAHAAVDTPIAEAYPR